MLDHHDPYGNIEYDIAQSHNYIFYTHTYNSEDPLSLWVLEPFSANIVSSVLNFLLPVMI